MFLDCFREKFRIATESHHKIDCMFLSKPLYPIYKINYIFVFTTHNVVQAVNVNFFDVIIVCYYPINETYEFFRGLNGEFLQIYKAHTVVQVVHVSVVVVDINNISFNGLDVGISHVDYSLRFASSLSGCNYTYQCNLLPLLAKPV